MLNENKTKQTIQARGYTVHRHDRSRWNRNILKNEKVNQLIENMKLEKKKLISNELRTKDMHEIKSEIKWNYYDSFKSIKKEKEKKEKNLLKNLLKTF